MKKILCLIVFLLSVTLQAQPPISLGWDQDFATPTEAQAFIYKIYLDGATTGTILQAVLCGSVNSVTRCSAPLNVSIGTHKLTMTAEENGAVSPASVELTFKWPATPSTPKNLQIIKSS
jgi:hypothetical protein